MSISSLNISKVLDLVYPFFTYIIEEKRETIGGQKGMQGNQPMFCPKLC